MSDPIVSIMKREKANLVVQVHPENYHVFPLQVIEFVGLTIDSDSIITISSQKTTWNLC